MKYNYRKDTREISTRMYYAIKDSLSLRIWDETLRDMLPKELHQDCTNRAEHLLYGTDVNRAYHPLELDRTIDTALNNYELK